jgi:hypothetical protein
VAAAFVRKSKLFEPPIARMLPREVAEARAGVHDSAPQDRETARRDEWGQPAGCRHTPTTAAFVEEKAGDEAIGEGMAPVNPASDWDARPALT